MKDTLDAQEGRWEAVLGRVLELTVLLGRDMAHHLAEAGLTESRAQVLWQLLQQGPSTQRALATALDVAPRTVTGLVDGLVATGFVTREPHLRDRRASLVTFTAHGRATAEALAVAQRQLARDLLADLPPDVFAGFDAGLTTVLVRLRAALADPDASERGNERGHRA